MANIKLLLGAVNITDYLIVTAAKVASPTIEEARVVFAPPHPASRNVILPQTGEIDAANYIITFYSSTDGTTLTQQRGQFERDVRNTKIANEVRFYLAGGTGSTDPAGGQNQLIDSYLDGKTLVSVQREGFRPLVPPAFPSLKEYDVASGGVITLTQGQTFQTGEVITIVITYLTSFEDSASNNGFYTGTVLYTADQQLVAADRNKRVKCEATGATMKVTLEALGSFPTGKFYYFHSNGGNQKNVRLLPFLGSGDKFLFEGVVYDEISVGLGEAVRVEKYGSYWEVVTEFKGLANVGERITKGLLSVINTLPENATLQDGDIYPRLFYWIQTFLPATHKIIDDTVISPSYTHPAGKEGMFVVHSSQRKFRMPNAQGRVIKGLDNFTSYPGTTTRPVGYPGGTEAGVIGKHQHLMFVDRQITDGTFNNPPTPLTPVVRYFQKSGNESYFMKAGNNNEVPTVGVTDTGKGAADENTVKNIGDVFLRRV